MKITLVKKIMRDGSPCNKCQDVLDRLEKNNQMQAIDQILIADERDPLSPGMLLAEQFAVSRAPFFVVEQEGQEPQIYTVYFQFVKEVLQQQTQEQDELKEILNDHQDLDFI